MRRGRLAVGAVLLVCLGLVPAFTAANAVPASRVDARTQSITANALKPSACAALALTAVASVNGSNPAELVLGTGAADTMRGNQNDDCMLGGAGNDSLRGDNGTDVCIGGLGTDTFDKSCETQIQ